MTSLYDRSRRRVKVSTNDKEVKIMTIEKKLILANRLKEHLTKKTNIHIIMSDGTNYWGRIIQINDNKITMENDRRPGTLMQFNGSEIRILREVGV
jgi:hypothetical protein